MGHRSLATPIKCWTGLWTLLLGLTILQQPAWGHGSVSLEEDRCLMQVGFFRAHFKIYLPERMQHEQFCEDLPVVGESVFVMEYVHEALDNAPIDFRIIRNVTGLGRFTRLQDVEHISNLEEITVFHHPAATQADVFTVLHDFESAGQFVGIVTVQHPDTQQVYTAVFPFKVGFTGVGYGPLFVLAAIVLHLHYLYMTGWFARRRRKSSSLDVSPDMNHG